MSVCEKLITLTSLMSARRFEEQFADFAGRTYIGDTGWGCEIVSLEADIQIIPFSLWD